MTGAYSQNELGNADQQEIGRWANNLVVQNSHLPFRRKFASVHADVHDHFNLERHLIDRQPFEERRSAALAEWQIVASRLLPS